MTKAILFLPLLALIACGPNASEIEAKIKADLKRQQDSIATSEIEVKKIEADQKNEPNLNFEQLYPILKKSLLEIVCESYRVEEKRTSLEAYSKESDMFLSSWEWDLNNQPILIKDIDNDGLKDYTIELFNSGGGCGGQIGRSERWTLSGSKPDRFEWTHTIPYRSESGKWEKN
jgi:hypothetical protein